MQRAFKKEDSKLITYQSGDNRSMIHYLMVRKTDRCLVKVISSEECVPQHQMVIGRLVIPMKPQKKKIVMFVPKPRLWKLKDEETARLFTHEMEARNHEVTKADISSEILRKINYKMDYILYLWTTFCFSRWPP